MTTPDVTIIETTIVPIGDLNPLDQDDNPRRGNLPAIMESLRRFGQFAPLIVNKRSGNIVSGNHTWQAMVEVGFTECQVSWIDVDQEAETGIILAANRTSDLADYDDSVLLSTIRQLESLEGTGWSDDDVDALEAVVFPDQFDGDDESLPDAGDSPGLGEPVISYTLVFDDEDQKRAFVDFLKWLRANNDGETHGERLAGFIRDQVVDE